MAHSEPLGRKSFFLPINPAEGVHEGDHADLICDNGGTTVVVRFPQKMLLNIPTEPRCATIEGDATLELRLNAEAFVEGFELVLVDEMDVFADSPIEDRQLAELPY